MKEDKRFLDMLRRIKDTVGQQSLQEIAELRTFLTEQVIYSEDEYTENLNRLGYKMITLNEEEQCCSFITEDAFEKCSFILRDDKNKYVRCFATLIYNQPEHDYSLLVSEYGVLKPFWKRLFTKAKYEIVATKYYLKGNIDDYRAEIEDTKQFIQREIENANNRPKRT